MLEELLTKEEGKTLEFTTSFIPLRVLALLLPLFTSCSYSSIANL